MKVKELIKALQAVNEEAEVNISIMKQGKEAESQNYLVSSPDFIVEEQTESQPEVSLRDWPY